MNKEKYRWTQKHERAYSDWVAALNPPSVARDAVKKKMKRLQMSPEQIIADREYLLSVPQKKCK